MFDYTKSEILEGGNVTKENDRNFNGKVYFITKGEDVLYIGQSINLESRLSCHHIRDFDNISFIKVPEHAMGDVEAHYIVEFKPKFNKMLPSSNLFFSERKISSLIKDVIKSETDKLTPAWVYTTGSKGYEKKNKHYRMSDFNLIKDKIIQKIKDIN